MSDARRIKELLRERVAALAQYLFPDGHREAAHWCVGSIDGEPGKSFKICIAGAKTGLCGDFAESGKHSQSLLDLWMQARNVDFKGALREAAEWLGQPLNGSNGVAQSVPKTRSTATFRTLDDAITKAYIEAGRRSGAPFIRPSFSEFHKIFLNQPSLPSDRRNIKTISPSEGSLRRSLKRLGYITRPDKRGRPKEK